MRQWDSNGNLIDAVQLTGSNPQDAKTPGVGDSNALHSAYNGATWDRWRNNTSGTLLASAARTISTISPVQTNFNGKGVKVFLNVTAASGTGGLTVRIESVDPISGIYAVDLVATVAITATGLYVYELFPGSSSAAPGTGSNFVNQRAAGLLSRTWQARVNHGDATSYTYSLGHSMGV